MNNKNKYLKSKFLNVKVITGKIITGIENRNPKYSFFFDLDIDQIKRIITYINFLIYIYPKISSIFCEEYILSENFGYNESNKKSHDSLIVKKSKTAKECYEYITSIFVSFISKDFKIKDFVLKSFHRVWIVDIIYTLVMVSQIYLLFVKNIPITSLNILTLIIYIIIFIFIIIDHIKYMRAKLDISDYDFEYELLYFLNDCNWTELFSYSDSVYSSNNNSRINTSYFISKSTTNIFDKYHSSWMSNDSFKRSIIKHLKLNNIIVTSSHIIVKDYKFYLYDYDYEEIINLDENSTTNDFVLTLNSIISELNDAEDDTLHTVHIAPYSIKEKHKKLYTLLKSIHLELCEMSDHESEISDIYKTKLTNYYFKELSNIIKILNEYNARLSNRFMSDTARYDYHKKISLLIKPFKIISNVFNTIILTINYDKDMNVSIITDVLEQKAKMDNLI